MIHHVYSILCGKSVTDPETDQITLIDVIDEITVHLPKEPLGEGQQVLTFPCVLVTSWLRTSHDGINKGQVKLVLQLPSGKSFSDDAALYAIDLTTDDRLRVTGKMTSLPIGEWGLYWFLIKLQLDGTSSWEDVGRVPFHVTQSGV